jgi:hypothetical protein
MTYKKSIWYAGVECFYERTFDEKDDRWDREAQAFIDDYKSHGVKACCIHRGNKHYLYVEKIRKNS